MERERKERNSGVLAEIDLGNASASACLWVYLCARETKQTVGLVWPLGSHRID